MSQTTELSEAKRALLNKYLRGNISETPKGTSLIPRRPQSDVAPLSYGQQQLWLLAQLMPDTPVYNECVTIYLPGPLDVAALEWSLNEIIKRHEAWRTSFPAEDGQPIQRIHPSLTLPLPVVDLRRLPSHEREAEALRLSTGQATQMFDLAQGPLLRATLLRLDDMDHRLFLTLHHIIFDGLTIYQVFLPELHTLYESFLSGQPASLPPLPIQYADYAYWQRASQKEDVFAEHLAYWKQQLQDIPAALELPTDRPRPPIQSHLGSVYPFQLSARLTDGLREVSRQAGTTLYMSLVAAFQTLLHRYTRQDDILLGTATSSRKYIETQNLLGFFLNTLVLRTDLSGNPTFLELLKRVREVILAADTHRDVPFEYVVKELQPDRNLSQNPLFQVLLSLVPQQPVLSSGWTLTQMNVQTHTSKFDLSIELDERSDGIIGRLVYSTDLFDEPAIARMVGHWQILLEGIIQNPNQSIVELPLLTDAERQQILVEWNDTAIDYPGARCIHQLIEAQVEQTPSAVAVIFEDQQLTYQELNRKANRLAHYLQQQGVGPEVLVGVCMERSMEMAIALLGVLKAGGAYVPLDPTYPQERLAFMLQDAHVPVLLTQTHLVDQLPREDVKLICLDADWHMPEQEENPVSSVQPDNLAYMIYTSGSTGRPKGVMNIHRGACNRLHSIQQAHSLTTEDRVLQKTPFSFDVSVWEFFWPLFTGATLVIAKPGGHQDPAYLASLIAEQKITALHFVPSMLQAFLLEPRRQQCNSLKQVFCGGEALSYELQERFFSCFDAQLYNFYGPTEASIDVTYWHCRHESEQRVVPIGRPIANTQIYILDQAMHPVPVGVPGELYVGGVGVARGYFNRPELTAASFIPNPFSQEAGAKLFKTGDLARYRVDGAIEFLGRIDHQVKVRGFRIELGEIEAVIGQHPAVREAVVVAREDTPGNKHLVAYLVLHEEQTASVANLRAYMMKELPAYMVPSAFVLLSVLPLTPNGKVDRRALPVPNSVSPELQKDFVAPRTPIEETLTDIWSKIFRIEQVGIHDNFFELGGHSLLAMQVISHLRTTLGVELPPRRLFEAPTIAELAKIIEQLKANGTESQMPALRAISREEHRVTLPSARPTRDNSGSRNEKKRRIQ
ncbi:MAG: hypothetical protein NVSMB49_08120 [Ktedonobacteraceae bacterium]